MSALSGVHGNLRLDFYGAQDPIEILQSLPVEGFRSSKGPGGEWLFSFAMKECRLDYLREAAAQLSQLSAREFADENSEWYYLEGEILVTHESCDDVAVLRMRNGKLVEYAAKA